MKSPITLSKGFSGNTGDSQVLTNHGKIQRALIKCPGKWDKTGYNRLVRNQDSHIIIDKANLDADRQRLGKEIIGYTWF